MIDEVVSRGMGGRVEVSEKDGLASERGGGAGGGVGTAADGTVKAKGVHGVGLGGGEVVEPLSDSGE